MSYERGGGVDGTWEWEGAGIVEGKGGVNAGGRGGRAVRGGGQVVRTRMRAAGMWVDGDAEVSWRVGARTPGGHTAYRGERSAEP